MDKSSLEFFKKLLSTPSPSGYEEAGRKVWRDEVKKFADEMRTDPHGSEIATLKGTGDVSVLLMGHIDEIGLIVRYIDDKGFLYFGTIGGIDNSTLISQRVRLLGPKGTVEGVIGKIAIHLQNEEERKKQKSELHELWIDIGARTKEEAAKYAPIGTPAVVGEDFIELLNGRFAARCFDNKMGAYVVAETMRRIAKKKKKIAATIYSVATVQEETGCWGAGPVAFGLEPTAAIAVDVSHAVDIPGGDKRRHGDCALGEGAILNIGVKSNKKLVADIKKAASSLGVEIQMEYETGKHGTDADPVAAIRAGIPVATISNPLRYMHTSVEMSDMKDITAVVDVLEAFLTSLGKKVDYTP